MKSIYSLGVLQRIVDRWGIGRIEDVTYFENVAAGVWRHYIETNQGDFEMYSYVPSEREYAEPKLEVYFEKWDRKYLDQTKKRGTVHSFDRNHVLVQRLKKHRINIKQAVKDLDLLVGSKIEKAFRVYGSIFQMHLNEFDVNKASVLVSYGQWSICDHKDNQTNTLADTKIHERDQLDTIIEKIAKDTPQIEKYLLQGDLFVLYLTNGLSISFSRSPAFPAIEVHVKTRKNDVLIFTENEIYYRKDV